MKAFVAVVASLVAAASGAPSAGYGTLAAVAPAAVAPAAVAPAAYAAGAVAVGPSQYLGTVPAGPAVHQVHETVHAGPAVAETVVQHGVVGQRTVKVGTQAVQVGHQYNVVGQDVHQRPSYSFQAGPPTYSKSTRPIAPPALPVAGPAAAVIPPAPRNLGPAPADTVTQEKILAPVRTHTQITPRVTQVVPELKVNRYAVEVPVKVPVPVHREVLVEKRVQRPYTVEVPRAVPVAVPQKYHPVHEVVHTPVVREHTVSHHAAPAVHTVSHHAAAPAVAVAAAPVAAVHKY